MVKSTLRLVMICGSIFGCSAVSAQSFDCVSKSLPEFGGIPVTGIMPTMGQSGQTVAFVSLAQHIATYDERMECRSLPDAYMRIYDGQSSSVAWVSKPFVFQYGETNVTCNACAFYGTDGRRFTERTVDILDLGPGLFVSGVEAKYISLPTDISEVCGELPVQCCQGPRDITTLIYDIQFVPVVNDGQCSDPPFQPGPGDATGPSVSLSGWVAFSSSDIGITNPAGMHHCEPLSSHHHVYAVNVLDHRVIRLSESPTGDLGGAASGQSAISRDGRFVAYSSDADNLLDPLVDTNARADIFVYDLEMGQNIRVNVATDGSQAVDGDSEHPAISADGRFVVFASSATNLTGTTVSGTHVYLHDRRVQGTGAFDVPGNTLTMMVDVTPSGEVPSAGSDEVPSNVMPAISGDGRFVAFNLRFTDIVPLVSNTSFPRQVFVRGFSPHFPYSNLDHVAIKAVTVKPSNPSEFARGDCSWTCISDDGDVVAFQSSDSELVAGDDNIFDDVFRAVGTSPFGAGYCYTNCDGSTAIPVLNTNDFNCFLNAYAAGDPYANCDGSTAPPLLNSNDFNCFLNAYAAGCS